jgi:hypothetical protein
MAADNTYAPLEGGPNPAHNLADQGGQHPEQNLGQHLDQHPDQKPASLLNAAPRVINVGLELFALDLAANGAAVQHVQWAPPAHSNTRLLDLLSKLGC